LVRKWKGEPARLISNASSEPLSRGVHADCGRFKHPPFNSNTLRPFMPAAAPNRVALLVTPAKVERDIFVRGRCHQKPTLDNQEKQASHWPVQLFHCEKHWASGFTGSAVILSAGQRGCSCQALQALPTGPILKKSCWHWQPSPAAGEAMDHPSKIVLPWVRLGWSVR